MPRINGNGVARLGSASFSAERTRLEARFVYRHGNGVKWEPDDDLCVAAQVLFSPATKWRAAGTVAVVVDAR